MVYFNVNGLGYDCGYNEDKCPKEELSCIECIKARLMELGFEFDSSIEIYKVNSIDKQLKLERETIWQKFLDVLNIKHIIIMDKGSGLTLLNYTVSGVNIDANLLSGFIQANITFSESKEVSDQYIIPLFEHNYYEFQYKSFNILLKDGDHVRVCLILDHKASNKLKNHTFRFVEEFEQSFEDELVVFQDTGAIDFKEMINAIVESFNINLMFPMTLARSIPPYELEEVKRSLVQNAIYNLAKEMLAVKPFFFIYNMLKRLKKIVNIEDEVVIYEIHQLLERNVFTPTSIEAMADNIESVQAADQKKEIKTSSISSITMNTTDIDTMKDQLKTMDKYSAQKLIKEIMRKAKMAEKDSGFQVTLNEYNKALYIAKDFKFKEEVNKISQKIFNLEHKSKSIELDFNIEKAENAEKYGDFINCINYYQKALEILDGFKVYNITDPRIKKFKKKILKLREEI
ncbi:MAG: hypothetical protein ACFFKA_05670 [Candidatus Thorarchaeota archaeon]